jgi:ribosome biogenesis GTPase
MPDFVERWQAMLGAGLSRSISAAAAPIAWTRMTYGSGRPGAIPATDPIRPKHTDATSGFVVAIGRGRYTCLVDGTEIMAMKARELGRKGIAVGDRVALVGEIGGDPGALARIVRVEPRASVLRRTADDSDPIERIIVANADQLVIVSALANPEPRPRLIDRCLVAAYDAGLHSLLCLTKADLAPAEPLVEIYAPLGLDYVVTRRGGDLDPLRDRLADRISVLVGHSGVGKSTLVNARTAGKRQTGQVNPVTGRGRHISASAVALELPGGGWVVDTQAYAASGLRTSTSAGSSTRFRIWRPAPRTVRGRAATTSRTAPWTRGWPQGTRIRPGSLAAPSPRDQGAHEGD